jgi:glutamate racemase
MVVIACNTASACSYEQIKLNYDLPVVEVVQPGAAAAVKATKNKRVGIIGTNGTIESGVYEKALTRLDSSIQIFSKACPLFVSLAEEGWWDNDIAFRVAEEYLMPLKQKGIDTLVLGCTHYPLLQKTIGKVMGNEVTLVNSAQEVAKVVAEVIKRNSLSRDNNVKPVYRYYTSDSVSKFEALGGTFLNRELKSAEKVDIEKY